MSAWRSTGQRGVTLIELTVVLAVIAVLAAVAVPSFTASISRSKLRAAADQLLGQLYSAKSESLKAAQPVFFSVSPGASACYGFRMSQACDCTGTGAAQCTMSTASLPSSGPVSISATTVANGSGNFEPVRGAVVSPGTVTFTNGAGLVIKVGVSSMGRVFSCSPTGAGNVPGYPTTNC